MQRLFLSIISSKNTSKALLINCKHGTDKIRTYRDNTTSRIFTIIKRSLNCIYSRLFIKILIYYKNLKIYREVRILLFETI